MVSLYEVGQRLNLESQRPRVITQHAYDLILADTNLRVLPVAVNLVFVNRRLLSGWTAGAVQ